MKSIKIVYDMINGHGDSVVDFAIIPFSKKTTEYAEGLSYKENMEAMIYDILESGFVFVNDTLAVPIFNIRQYMAYEETQVQKQEQRVEKVEKTEEKQGKKWKPIHHGKKMHRRMGNQVNQTQTQIPVVVPIKPEEVIKEDKSEIKGENQ